MPQATKISKGFSNFHFLFSICTMVTDQEEYELMKSSFEQCGFVDECEYLIADNSAGNSFDAYEAIAGFIKQALGKYIIIVHQDVRCIDTKAMLLTCINELTKLDEKWAVCGNAGASGYHDDIIYLTNNNRVAKTIKLPAKATSLDENFLLLKNGVGLTVSNDIKGFHLYGTDLALIADFLGFNCYVIPFMVKHLSLGNLEALNKDVDAFVESYGRKFKSRYVQTSCTKFYLGNSVSKNIFLNHPVIFYFVKAVQRIPQVSKFLKYGNRFKKTEAPEK
jgi:hypothetical protein